jgi:hypothetical protein
MTFIGVCYEAMCDTVLRTAYTACVVAVCGSAGGFRLITSVYVFYVFSRGLHAELSCDVEAYGIAIISL